MDDPEKDEEQSRLQTNPGPDRDSQISEEELQEREERTTTYRAGRVGVSQGTDTKDDPLPPRKKKKIPPAVPVKRHLGDTESQTDGGSADSVASAPRSRRSVRSASSELPSSSRSSRKGDGTPQTQSLDRDGRSSQEERKKRSKKLSRHIDYDTVEVLKQGEAEDEKDSLSGGSSFHWRMSQSSLNVQSMDSCVSGLTGFIVTALAMGLLIMISWFIISQLDFILMVVTWTAKSLEESMLIFKDEKERPRVENPRVGDFRG